MSSSNKDDSMIPANIDPNKTYICINDWKDMNGNVIAECGKLYSTSKSHYIEIDGNPMILSNQEFRIHFEEIDLV